MGGGARAKILPILLFGSVAVPAAIFVIIASVTEQFGVSDLVEVPGHADYFEIVSILVLLFAAIIAPELLCADRRSQVLQLYLVRPLTSADYVAGRWLAFFAIVLALVYSGQVVMFVGFTFAAEAPLDYIRANWLDVPRFVAAGAVVAIFAATIPLAVAGFTSRRAYATGFVIGLFIICTSFANVITGEVTNDWAKYAALLDILNLPNHLVSLIFDDVNDMNSALQQMSNLNDVIPIAWYAALVVGSAALLLRRYRREGQ